MDYAECLEWRRQKTQKEIAELPDTPNILTGIREFYSFKSLKRTTEVLLATLLVCVGIVMLNQIVDFSLWQALTAFLSTQAATFALGVYLRNKFKG